MGKLTEIFNNYPDLSRDNLIPILQDIQDKDGFLSKESIVEVGSHLRMPSSKIYGVATFYNQFKFQPNGKYHIQICRGTACHVLGSASVLSELEKQLKIKAGQTTRDQLFSLEIVACIGACGLAPVISINGEFYANVDEIKLSNILSECRKNKEEKL
ncbi:MAG: NADH-quinone oxidoreductase subunit NuoE [Marinilabiliales bacterium]|nr:MAG: NADH-quinone oxidoreductase subunit NuoE [Marinilabiliales bacterium]